MNRIPVTLRAFADLSVILRQAKSLTVHCLGQEFTDLVVTESAGEVVIETNAPTPWDADHVVSRPHTLEAEAALQQPKRRGRPPKTKLEGDTTA